jgi:hypothetical protein
MKSIIKHMKQTLWNQELDPKSILEYIPNWLNPIYTNFLKCVSNKYSLNYYQNNKIF